VLVSKTIQQTIKFWADKNPQKNACCLTKDSSSYTYQQLNQLCIDYGRWFKSHQLVKGDIICLALGNGKASIELLYAAYYNGLVVLPLNLASGMRAKKYVLNHSQPKIIFTDEKERKELISSAQEFQDSTIVIVESDQSPLNQIPLENIENATDTNFVETQNFALLMYTSGTTGNPKGVCLSQKNLLAGGMNTALAHQLDEQDKGLCVLPLYHINAQCVSVMACLISGSTLLLSEKFSVQRFFTHLSSYQATWCSIVPTMASYLLNEVLYKQGIDSANNLSALKFIRSASAPLPTEVHKQFEQALGIPIIETMGITETAAQILSNPRPPAECKIGTVGLAFGNQVQIRDSNGNVLPQGEEGEITIKGDNVMMHYYRNPEETEKSFLIIKNGSKTENWFLSGDLGIMDSQGYVTVKGRKKELIIKGGENISPREIDEVLYSFTDIIEAAAFAKPCQNYGQTIEACIVLDPQSKLTEQEILIYCTNELGKFKTPDKIHFFQELPKGPSGKIQRLKLLDFLQNQ
jgi:sulfoacetaldehyde dehydrogenase